VAAVTAPTVPVIVHRAGEYSSAGEVFGQMSADTVTTHAALITVLSTYAGMAGSDSVGGQWASAYDEAAQLAISSSSKLATACGQTRDLIVVGAHNHRLAETGSDTRNPTSPAPPQLSIAPCLAEDAPSAAGDGIPEPFGWSILADFVGFGWPNGHQDQLDAAKTAWHTASADYRTVAAQVPRAVELLTNQQSPEIGIAVGTCQERQNDLNALADACQTLGDSCGEYAHHLDEAHHKILEEVKDFLIETAAAEAVFAVLAPFTATVSEWVGNTALAGRIAVRARRIAIIIGELGTRVTEIVTRAIRPVTAALKPLLDKVGKWVDVAKAKLWTREARGATPGRGTADEWLSGGRRRPANMLDDPAQTKWAQDAYDNFTQDPRDISAISRNTDDLARANGATGFSEAEIAAIKKHLFDTEHPILDYETGQVVVRKFDPDPEIADAWIRLRSGNALPEDHVLLEHELAELNYLRANPGVTYQDAHRVANESFNWQNQVPLNKREDFESGW
jgi:hypothetical protein